MGEQRLNIDREALIKALRTPTIRANAEWCVACGAGAAAGPELPRILEQEIAKKPELLHQLIHPDFVRDLATRLSGARDNADWCVACGASAATGPEARVLPATEATLSNADIETIADRVLRGLEHG